MVTTIYQACSRVESKIIDAEIETDCDFHEEIVSYEEWIEQQNEKPVEQQLLLALLNYKKSME